MQPTAERIWAAAQQYLRGMLNPDIYNLWFASLRATELHGDNITLEVANDFCELWLKDNYLGLLRDVLAQSSGQALDIKFQISATPTVRTGSGADAIPPSPRPEQESER